MLEGRHERFLFKQGEAEWNKWLAGELLKLVRDVSIPRFLAKQEWRGGFQKVLAISEMGNHPIWDELLRKPLSSYLATADIFPTADGSLTCLANCVRVPQVMKELLGEKELEILNPGKKLVSDSLDYEVQSAPADSLLLIINEGSSGLLQEKAKQHDIEWFQKLYAGLKTYLPITAYRKKQLRDATPFLLTEDFTLASLDMAHTNPNSISIAAPVAHDFNVLHKDLFVGAGAATIEEVVSGLGIQALSESLIKKAIVQHQLPDVADKWGSLADIERMEWIALFKDYSIDSRDLKFVTLPTRADRWKEPKSIVFSTEYNPSPDLEKLVAKGLLDTSDLTEPCLDPASLKGSQDPGIVGGWVSFFRALGVGEPLTQNKLVQLAQRTATRASIRYEKARGYDAHELPESESHMKGYDIESKCAGSTRLIEAKGRTGNVEITITHKQWDSLLLHTNDYYLYVVTEALSSDPVINPIQGANLKSIEFSLKVQPATWKAASEPSTQYSTLP